METSNVRCVVLLAALALGMTACASTSEWKQTAGEVPHYGLSEVKAKDGRTCYVYTERNNGVALNCVSGK